MVSTRVALGTVLTLGVVLIWAFELKVLQWVHRDSCVPFPPEPPPPPAAPAAPAHPPSPCHNIWDKPWCVGLALKALWALGLPPMLLRHRYRAAPPLPGSLTLSQRTVLACGGLTLLVQGASVTWIASVPLTSASLNSAIYQSSCALAYLFSLPLLKEETLSASKSLAVALALGGVALVLSAKRRRGSPDAVPNALGGDLLVLSSAALYALKEVLYKKWCGADAPASGGGRTTAEVAINAPPPILPARPAACAAANESTGAASAAYALGDEVPAVPAAAAAAAVAPAPSSSLTPVEDAALCVSLIGMWGLFTAPLWLALLHVSGVETFSLPPWALARGYIAVGLLMSVYQLMLFSAIALTSPTFVAVGQLLVAPISMVWDVVELQYALPPAALLGTVAIVAALALVIVAARSDAAMRRSLVWLLGAGGRRRTERKWLLRASGERSDVAPTAVEHNGFEGAGAVSVTST